MKKNNKGFTLVELSVVLTIMAIITVGFIQGNLVLLRKNKINATKKKLETIEKALLTYLLTNGNLPCPAGLTTDESSGDFAIDRSCTNGTDGVAIYDSNFVYGAVPTRTLNLADEIGKDEWGNRISYIVHIGYTDTSGAGTGFKTMNPESSALSVYVYTANTTTDRSILTDKAIYALISHGKNGVGGYSYNSGTRTNRAGNSIPEDLNISESDDTAFNGDIAYSYYSENFDDYVRYKTKNQMIIDLDWEDIGCFIDMSLLNNNEPDASCVDLTSQPSSPLSYNTEHEWDFVDSTDCCVAKCFKYGRAGFYLKGSDCD
jgi:prepilin-type N-terminal cleavage/methylation domain-containing protein